MPSSAASASLMASVGRFLGEHAPFAQMASEDRDWVAKQLELAYFADGEVIVSAAQGEPDAAWIVHRGQVAAWRDHGVAGQDEPLLQLTAGEIFPVGALLARRPVTHRYQAVGDVFCWRLTRAHFDAIARRSPVFLDFCRRRLAALLDLARQDLQASQDAQVVQWRAMSEPVSRVMRAPVLSCAPDTPLREVFRQMEARRAGSVLVFGHQAVGAEPATVCGIFTRHDVIARVALPGLALDAPVSAVMSAPVRCIDHQDSVANAMLVMAEQTIRHLPVLRGGALVGIVSERDLFVLQRRGLRQIGDAIRHAGELGPLRQAAQDIRDWSLALVAQGITPAFVTRLVSRLNDQLGARLISLIAGEHGVSLDTICWLALGSEGREEQTVASDQDNALIVGAHCPTPLPALLAFAQAVNRALADCGFPLCRGEIMAGNPTWCLTESQWVQCFERWIERGDPPALLHAAIFFDLRPMAGARALGARLGETVRTMARANPRFLKQMADNALANRPPAGWTAGLLDAWRAQGDPRIDLKMQGTVPFVDAARVLSLAHGVAATGTAERLQALQGLGLLEAGEVGAWVDAFQFLQGLRLRVQAQARQAGAAQPNHLDPASLSELERRILKEAFRQARKLQQRLAVDYPG